MRSLDDGYEPDRCAANTKKLIDDDVFALFGYIGTPTSLAALPLAVKAQGAVHRALHRRRWRCATPFNRYVFHLRASYYDETARDRQAAHLDLGLKKIAVFYQNDAYGKAGLDGVTLALKPLDLKPAAAGTVERNSVDVAAAVKTIVAAQARRGGADQRLQVLRRLHPRGAQGRLRRHLLQRVLRRHPGAGRRNSAPMRAASSSAR